MLSCRGYIELYGIHIYIYAGGISGLYTWQILSAGCLGKFAAGCALQYPIQTACFAVFFLSAPSLICLNSLKAAAPAIAERAVKLRYATDFGFEG